MQINETEWRRVDEVLLVYSLVCDDDRRLVTLWCFSSLLPDCLVVALVKRVHLQLQLCFVLTFVQKNGQPDRRTTATMAEQQPTPPPSHNAPVIKIDDAIEAIGMGK